VERDGRGTPLGLRSAANDYTTILDGLGSVVAIVGQDGIIAARYTYDPYGAAVSVSEPGLNQPNVVRFAGGLLDETTGLTKFGKRFYDPNLGRFTQLDILNVVGDPLRGNRYAYAGCNPINNIDPTGMDLCKDLLIKAGIFAVLSGLLWFGSSIAVGTIVGIPAAPFLGGLAAIAAVGAGIYALEAAFVC
jgi:RHS repeat-associated protein